MNKLDTHKAKILILCIYHFKNKGGHLVNIDTPDIMTENKQKEIVDIVNRLYAFKPTKVAVEAFRTKSHELNDYYAVNKNNYSNPSEIVQIGFRIASKFNHEHIYAIDVDESLPYEPALEYAKNNMPDLYNEFQKHLNESSTIETELHKKASVLNFLRYINRPGYIADEHSKWCLKS